MPRSSSHVPGLHCARCCKNTKRKDCSPPKLLTIWTQSLLSTHVHRDLWGKHLPVDCMEGGIQPSLHHHPLFLRPCGIQDPCVGSGMSITPPACRNACNSITFPAEPHSWEWEVQGHSQTREPEGVFRKLPESVQRQKVSTQGAFGRSSTSSWILRICWV